MNNLQQRDIVGVLISSLRVTLLIQVFEEPEFVGHLQKFERDSRTLIFSLAGKWVS